MNPTTIRDNDGRVIGYRCSYCEDIVSVLWGNICNACRRADEEHDEIIAALLGKEDVK